MKDIFFALSVIVCIFPFGGVAQADINDGLVAYYSLDGDATDASGKGNHGTIIGDVSFATGHSSQAASFNDGNSYIEVSDDESLNFTGDFTIVAWVQKTDNWAQTHPMIVAKNPINSAYILWVNHDYRSQEEADFSIRVAINGRNYTCRSNIVPEDNRWYFIVAIKRDTNLQIYVDGEIQNSISVPSNAVDATSGALTISDALSTTDSFNGNIDEVRLYNRALSESEIQELYTATDSGDTGQTPATPPESPVLTVTTSGTTLNLSWAAVSVATGYTLHYAPYPYAGAHTIAQADMGTNTSFSATLWDGASYYVTITSTNDAGESGYSNVELFTIVLSNSEDDIIDTDYSWIVPYKDINDSTIANNLLAVGSFAVDAGSSIALSYLGYSAASFASTIVSTFISEIELVGGTHSTRIILLDNNGVVDIDSLNVGEEYSIICISQPSSGMELPQNLYINEAPVQIAPYISSPFMGELIIPKRTFSFDYAGEYEISCGESSFWRNQIETTSVTVQNSPTFSYVGNYSGSFSGDDYGTWNVIISDDGSITGSAQSNIVGTISVSGSVDNDGNAVFGGATNYGTNVSFKGLFSTNGVVSGSWITTLRNQGIFEGNLTQ